ncbi:MAG TPA: DNA mismatch repair protein MutS [Thermomicrobiales bacterium]|nr:DNA mismatch repair protein MutS [Thermomicrobiales bacterium]
MSTTKTGKASDSKVVPLRQQYLQIKARYPDTILFFRLGDFYETFDDDAKIAAEVLDIVLTGREMGKDLRVPMAGIPYHSADGYIARLIAAGHKIAVCEQIGETTRGRGLVERDVTQVITPGTVVDPSMLDARQNNDIVGLAIDGKRAGIAFADITTGEFRTTQITADDEEELLLAVGRELLRLHTAEVVMPADLTDSLSLPMASWLPEGASTSRSETWRWQEERAAEALMRHFGVDSLDGFGTGGKPLATRAAGGLLQYLEETQLSGLRQITSLATYSTAGYMTLDAQTIRNLDLSESQRGDRRHSLTAVLDRTETPMGARLLRRWIRQPLLDVEELEARLDGVEFLVNDASCRARLIELLDKVKDIERLVNRALIGNATPRELGTLRDTLAVLADIGPIGQQVPHARPIPAHSDLAELLESALVEDPPVNWGKAQVIRSGFASDLDGYRLKASEAREWIANLERTERERTGIKSLKVGYNRVFGYYIEVTTAALASADRDRMAAGESGGALPEEYIPKQSLTNATRYFTPELKEYETLVLNAEGTLSSMEQDVFHRVMRQVAEQAGKLLETAAAIAWLDTIAALADVAARNSYVRPEIDESPVVEISAGRHPVLETTLPAGEFVPNDARLDSDDDQIIILTGPNMAGKSSWLRQVALIALMAQIGSFVPASRARIGLVDRIFTRIGAQDNIATGQSTFMVEMLETANILHHATPRSLVVLDEIGRGTSTYDGLAIARAIVEHLHNASHLGCKTLFATHYHELTELAGVLPRVRAFRMEVLEEGDQVIFLRQVVPGGADRSYGIHVAQLAGLPRAIVRRASEILTDLESNGHGDQQPGTRRQAMAQSAPIEPANLQLTFFNEEPAVVGRLRNLDVESLSPLEALNLLYELKREVTP